MALDWNFIGFISSLVIFTVLMLSMFVCIWKGKLLLALPFIILVLLYIIKVVYNLYICGNEGFHWRCMKITDYYNLFVGVFWTPSIIPPP